jgi:glutaredoxin-related protein
LSGLGCKQQNPGSRLDCGLQCKNSLAQRCCMSRGLHAVQVEAEKVSELSGHLEVTAVPTFVFLSKGDVVDRLEGYDPAALYAKAAQLADHPAAAPANSAQPASQQDAKENTNVNSRLKQLVAKEPVMLFMKGSPEAPRCGFSRKVVEALKQEQIPFGHFDILSDEQARSLTYDVLQFLPALWMRWARAHPQDEAVCAPASRCHAASTGRPLHGAAHPNRQAGRRGCA